MTLDEARAILAAQDESDPVRALQAVAVWMRYEAIAEPRLLSIAGVIEVVADSLRAAPPQEGLLTRDRGDEEYP